MAAERVLAILERLAGQPAAPFHEEGVAREASRIARAAGARVRADPFGNLVFTPPRKAPGPALWLVAHMDHPGFEYRGGGEALFLGGIGPGYLRRGVPLRFYRDGEPVAATIARLTRKARPMRVRLAGAEGKRLRRGDFGVFEMADFRASGDRVHARQLDDLVGCAVSLAAIERACRRRANVRALLTRAEELGFVGTIGAAVSGTIPRGAWIVNVEASRAIPGVRIGGGPVIRVGDRARTFDMAAENLLAAARARLGDRPVQRALLTGGTCEATAWALFGYRSTGVALPLGNYHNQGPRDAVRPEVIAATDLATAADLVDLAARHAPAAASLDDRVRRRLHGYLRRHGPRLRDTRDALLG
ncbi:MAG: hypothetical protein AABY30_05905 [Candidatus Thermoplasmatota archaeon]